MTKRKQGRYFRPRNDTLKGTPYDSLVEKALHEGPLKNCEFHPEKIHYVSEHTYEADFSFRDSQGIEWLIEAKSIFQDSKEAAKYKWIQKSLKDDQVLIFVLEKPQQTIYWQKKRKDGTKMQMWEWCEKQGFMWFTKDNIERILK